MAISATTFIIIIINILRECYWHLVGRSQESAKHHTMHRPAPPTWSTIWPKTSTVSRLRNLDLYQHTKHPLNSLTYTLGCLLCTIDCSKHQGCGNKQIRQCPLSESLHLKLGVDLKDGHTRVTLEHTIVIQGTDDCDFQIQKSWGTKIEQEAVYLLSKDFPSEALSKWKKRPMENQTTDDSLNENNPLKISFEL